MSIDRMICPLCHTSFERMCESCGVFFDEPEYIVHDHWNYVARPKRCYKREDHFKEVVYQFQGIEGKTIPKEVLSKLRE